MRKLVTVGVVTLVALGVVSLVNAAEKKSIKDVMKEAHGGGANSLLQRVAGGKGEKEDAEKLLALYKDLAANEPPKGEEKAWKTRTEAILTAAEAVVKGEGGAGAKLRTAANCMACHREHKAD